MSTESSKNNTKSIDKQSEKQIVLYKKNPIVLFAGLTVLVVTIALSVYSYKKYADKKLLQNPSLAAQKEIKETISKVGALMLLPTGEQATVATVSDKSKLQSQSFFKNAENGDKVLLYLVSKKAILYRLSINKIVEVAPINLQNTGNVAGASTTNTDVQNKTQATVSIFNGTTTVGLASTVEKQIVNQIPTLKVVQKTNAQLHNYAKTVVVDLTGKNQELVSKIASILNGTVSNLPENEVKPTTDIAVYIGK